MNYSRRQSNVPKYLPPRKNHFSNKINSISSFSVDLDEIHEILKKNIEKKEAPRHKSHKSSQIVSKYLKKVEKIPESKTRMSPCIFKPLVIRCQSPTLRLKYSRPKTSNLPNNFIDKKLTKFNIQS